MKNKGLILSTVILAAVVFCGAVKTVMGGTRSGAVIIDQGDSKQYRKISISSTTGTALWVADQMLADSICRVNGSYTIWLGSVTYAAYGYTHPNISNGFFLLPNETITLGGAFSGLDYATCDTGTASCEMRCRDSKVSY
jgi:hypothetical protein